MKRWVWLGWFLAGLSWLPGGCQYTAVEAPRTVPTPARAGIELLTQPAGGEIYFSGGEPPVSHGVVVRLEPGQYQLRSELAGHRDGYLATTITPDSRRVTVPLGPGFARVSVTSVPPGATCKLNGEVIGLTPVAVELDEGAHRVELSRTGYRYRSDIITVSPASPLRLNYELEGLPAAATPVPGKVGAAAADAAGDAPSSAVMPALVAPINPGSSAAAAATRRLQLDGSALSMPAFAANEVLIGALFDSMRPDEVLTLHRPGSRVVVDRRGGESVVSFRHRVEGRIARPDAASAPPQEELVAVSREQALGDIVAALVTARGWAPLLDLDSGQLGDTAEQVLRNRSDGPVTLIIIGGQGVAVRSGGRAFRLEQGYARIEAGAQPILVSWSQRPDRLLLSPAGNPHYDVPVDATGHLLGREKRRLKLMEESMVHRLVQFTRGPDLTGWVREEVGRVAHWGSRVPLATVELGPHDTPGLYERIWLLTIATAQGDTQRQYRARYSVSDAVKSFETHQFLRRNAGANDNRR